jgi:two-component system CheB/CheR fusion protein
MLLTVFGHRVRIARDGPSALEAARAEVPALMLVDIGLPGMDGYEVARRVRETAALNGIVLVALTGFGHETDRKRALAAGFDAHLTKPVVPAVLRSLVARLTAREEGAQESSD